MRILFLGGTKFLGRHAVDAALARGHAVTVFTRGRAPNHWGDAVTALAGDRDPLIPPGLDALRDGTWDAVIDTSGYVPRVVRASAGMLKDRAAQYLFVSSISVYADGGGAGRDESASTATLDDPSTEEVMKHYGPLKAACEDEVRAAFGNSAIIVRLASLSGRTIRPTVSAIGLRASGIRNCWATGPRRPSCQRRRQRLCSSSTSATLQTG